MVMKIPKVAGAPRKINLALQEVAAAAADSLIFTLKKAHKKLR